VLIEIDERRPPRPSLLPEIAGILGEAVRNAHQHADATRVRVHGWVNFDRGRLVVEDDGSGFDPAAPYPGHFGLLGMRERAQRVGGRLSIVRLERGTSISLEWGET
jgi:signal transduction histidine kinase